MSYTQVVVRQKIHDDILELLREEGTEAARKAQRGLIVQPGAIGDCILTLPLAAFMKEALSLGGIDMLGHTEYIGFLPGRSCIDAVISIDSVDMHRLFVEKEAFDLADRDPLISTFGGYAWIATFVGEPNSDFEHNLIYTANCSGSSEVVTLAAKAPGDFTGHLTDFYEQQFIAQSGLPLKGREVRPGDCLIKAARADTAKGRELLREAGLDPNCGPVVIQPGSGGVKKCWRLDNFLAVAGELKSKGVETLFLLGPVELERYAKTIIEKIAGVSIYLAELSLVEVLGLLACAGAFIGNDSGITHLAAGSGVRTFTLFGPTNPSMYRPIGPAVTIFKGNPKTFAGRSSVSLQRRLVEAVLV